MDEPVSLESNPEKPIDKDYKKKRVDEIGSALAQIRARVKANRACAKKEDENASSQKLPREKLSEKSEAYMQVLEQDKVKIQKLEKERPKMKEAIENLMIDRENQKLVEKKIEEIRAKLESGALSEIPQEVQNRILDLETTIHLLRESLAEKESVLQSKADSWRVVNEELEKRNAETVERADQMRREIESVREAYAEREKLLSEELETTRKQLFDIQEKYMSREVETRDAGYLQKELAASEEEVRGLKDSLRRFENDLARAQDALDKTERELDVTRTKLNSSEDNCVQVTKDLEAAVANHQECDTKFAEMKKAWDLEKRLALKLKAQLKNLRNEMALKKTEDVSKELEKLQNQVASLEEEKGNLQLQLVDFDDVKENAVQLNTRVSELESSLSATSAELLNTKKSYEIFKEDAERWAEQLQARESEIVSLVDRAAKAEQLKVEAELRAAALEERLDSAALPLGVSAATQSDLAAQRISASTQSDATQQGISTATQSDPAVVEGISASTQSEAAKPGISTATQSDLSHQVISTDSMSDLFQAKVATMQSISPDIIALREEIAGDLMKEWSSRYAEIEASTAQIMAERIKMVADYEEQIAQLTSRCSQLEATCNQLKMDSNNLMSEKNSIDAEDWKAQYGQLEERLISLVAERDSLLLEKDNLLSEIMIIKQERDNLSTSDTKNNSQYNQLQEKAKKIAAALKAKVTQCKDLKDRLAQAEETLTIIKDENLSLKSDLNESRATEATLGDRSPQDLTDANKMLEQQVSDLESRLSDAIANSNNLNQRLVESEDTVSKLQASLAQEKEGVQYCQSIEKELRDTIISLKAQLEEVERSMTEQQQVSDRLHQAEEAALEAALRSRLADFEVKLAEKIEEVELLKAIDAKRSEELQFLRQVEAKLKKDFENLQASLTSQRDEVYQLRENKMELQVLRDSEQKELLTLQTKLDELEVSLTEKENHLVSLEEEWSKQVQSAEAKALASASRAVELEAELNDIKSAYATTLDQIEALNEELKVVMGEIEGRNEQLVRVDAERRELAMRVQECESEIVRLKSELSSLSTRQDDDGCEWAADARLEEEHQGITALQKENEHLKEEVKTVKLNCAKLARRVKHLKEQIDQQGKRANDNFGMDELGLAEELRSQLDTAEAEQAKLNAELTTVRAERDKLKTRVDVLTTANEQLVDLKERHDIEVQGFRRTISELRAHGSFEWGEPSTSEPAPPVKVDTALKERTSILEAENEELQQAITEAQSEKQRMLYEVNSLKEEIRKLKDTTSIPLASNLFSDSTDSFFGQPKSSESKVVSDNKEQANLSVKVEELTKSLSELDIQLQSANSKNIELAEENVRLVTLHSDLEQQLQSINNKNSGLAEEIVKLTDFLSELKQQLQSVTTKHDNLLEENTKLAENYEKLKIIEKDLLGKINCLEEESESLRLGGDHRIETLRNELVDYQNEGKQLQEALNSATSENSALKLEIEKYSREVESLNIELNKLHSHKCEHNLVRADEIKSQSQPMFTEQPSIFSSPPIFKGFFSDSDDPFAGVSMPVKEEISVQKSSAPLGASSPSEITKEELLKKLNELERENGELLKKLDEAQTRTPVFDSFKEDPVRIQQLQGELMAHNEQVALLKQSLESSTHDRDAAIAHVNELQNKVKSLQDHIQSLNKQLQESLKASEMQNIHAQGLEKEVQDLRNNLGSLNASLLESNQDNSAKTTRIQELEREVESLVGHINLLNQAMNDSGRDRENKIGRLIELEKEVISLREHAQSLQTECTKREDCVKKLELDAESLKSQMKEAIQQRDSFSNQVKDLEQEVLSLRDRAQTLTAQLTGSSQFAGRVEQLEKETNGLRQHLAEVQKASMEEAQQREAWFQHALLAKEEEAVQLRQEIEAAAASQLALRQEAAAASERASAAEAAKEGALAAKMEAERRASEAMSNRDAELTYLSDGIVERDAALAERESALAQKDLILAYKDEALAQKDTLITERDSMLVTVNSEKERLQHELQAACERCNSIEQHLTQREAELNALQGSEQEVERLQRALEAKEDEVARLSQHFSDAQERLVAAEQNRPAGKELLGLRKRLDEALYTIHLRDVKCDELYREIMQLLEERDVLQLQLSEALRANEELRKNGPLLSGHPEPVSSIGPSFSNKLKEVHTGYWKDPVVKHDQQNRHSQQMSLLHPSQKGEKEDDSAIGLFQWIFGGSSSSEQT